MKRKQLGGLSLLLICVITLGACRTFTFEVPEESGSGRIDLSGEKFERDSYITLNALWAFYPEQLLSSLEDFDAAEAPVYIDVPGSWNSVIDSAAGYGTYRMELILPENVQGLGLLINGQNSAFTAFVNGNRVAGRGVVATTQERYTPDKKTALVDLSGVNSRTVSLVLQISNFHHRSGGLVGSVQIGRYDNLISYTSNESILNSIAIGLAFFVAFSNLFFFIFNRDRKIYLTFSITTFVFMIRELARDTTFLDSLFHNVSYQFYLSLEYITFFFMVASALHFLLYLASDVRKHRVIIIIFYAVAVLGTVLILVLPLILVSAAMVYFQGLIIVGVIYLIVATILDRTAKNRAGRILIVITIFLLFASIIQGILVAQLIIQGQVFDKLIFFVIILLHSGFLLQQFASSLYRAERLSVSFRRFVPEQFLNLLNRSDITEVSLGEHTQKQMSVFFADIRNFTNISEAMSPQDNFLFLNSYLKRVGPLIRENNGFIDKYIGDAVMGLFPNNPANGVQAAIDFHENLRAYNRRRQERGYQPLSIGVGIHTGVLMLGTIGETERMETTVISDSVNLASRVEGMTKVLGSPALITEDTYHALSEDDRKRFNLRKMHRMKVKGKDKTLFAYEILDCYAEPQKEKYLKSLKHFNIAMEYYMAKQFDKAQAHFREVLNINPNDRATQYYLKL